MKKIFKSGIALMAVLFAFACVSCGNPNSGGAGGGESWDNITPSSHWTAETNDTTDGIKLKFDGKRTNPAGKTINDVGVVDVWNESGRKYTFDIQNTDTEVYIPYVTKDEKYKIEIHWCGTDWSMWNSDGVENAFDTIIVTAASGKGYLTYTNEINFTVENRYLKASDVPLYPINGASHKSYVIEPQEKTADEWTYLCWLGDWSGINPLNYDLVGNLVSQGKTWTGKIGVSIQDEIEIDSKVFKVHLQYHTQKEYDVPMPSNTRTTITSLSQLDGLWISNEAYNGYYQGYYFNNGTMYYAWKISEQYFYKKDAVQTFTENDLSALNSSYEFYGTYFTITTPGGTGTLYKVNATPTAADTMPNEG